MRGAETGAVVRMKIFVKQVPLSLLRRAEPGLSRSRKRRFAILIAHPDFDQAIGKFVRDLLQGYEISGAGRTFHFEIVAVVMVKLLERFDQEIVDWEPDRAAPV